MRIKQRGLAVFGRGAVLLALLTGLVGALVALSPYGWILEENIGLNWLFQIRGARQPPDNVVIVGVDRQSAHALGQSPQLNTWPRALHAKLIDELVAAGAAVIVFDMYFGTAKADDAELARAIAAAKRVVLFAKSEHIITPAGPLTQLHTPVAELAAVARAIAPFPLPKIPNRVSRHWSFFNEIPTLPIATLQVLVLDWMELDWAEYDDTLRTQADLALPFEQALTASSMRKLMTAWREHLKAQPERAERLLHSIPASAPAYSALSALLKAYTAGSNYYFLNFYGPPATIPMLPYKVFWDDSKIPDLSGKVVFVGSMDPTHYEQPDQFITVFSTDSGFDLSGVEIVATAFANLLNDTVLRYPAVVARIIVIVIFGCLIGALIYSLSNPWFAASAALISGFLYLLLAQYLFYYQLWIPLVVPLLVQLPFGILAGLYYKYTIYRRAMRRYVPREVADAETSGSHPPEPEASYGVCLCTDVAGYTAISEQLLPADLARHNHEYFTALGEAIHRYGGEMLDITGDGMMCVWPSRQPSRAACENACLAALEIQAAVARFNTRHPDYPFPTRIGLHSGWLALGHMGGDGHYIYGVTGDVPVTASRIEGLNKHLGTMLLAERSVVKGLDDFLMRRLGQFQLKGKRDVLTVFQVIGLTAQSNPSEQSWYQHFEEAFSLYEAGQWQKALDHFQRLEQKSPGDKPVQFYRTRCEEYLVAPPAGEFQVVNLSVK